MIILYVVLLAALFIGALSYLQHWAARGQRQRLIALEQERAVAKDAVAYISGISVFAHSYIIFDRVLHYVSPDQKIEKVEYSDITDVKLKGYIFLKLTVAIKGGRKFNFRPVERAVMGAADVAVVPPLAGSSKSYEGLFLEMAALLRERRVPVGAIDPKIISQKRRRASLLFVAGCVVAIVALAIVH